MMMIILGAALCSLQVSAQDFAPFNPHTSALYTTSPDAGATSALGFTSAEVVDGDSVFHPVLTFDPTDWAGMIEPDYDECGVSFWATSGNCYPNNVPLWFGAEMRKTGVDNYQYTTSTGEHLNFDFSVNTGDSVLVYQNEELSLYLIGEGDGMGTYLGLDQATAEFRLAVIDVDDQIMESLLHDAPITLGAELGAVNFMRIDSFPQIMQPVTIAGHTGAEAGLYAVKAAEIYDFQDGDVFQYYQTGNYAGPYVTVSFYETRTVASRIDTDSSITYTFDVHRFKIDGTLDSNFTASQIVSKSEHLAEIPLEVQDLEYEFMGDISPLSYEFQSLSFEDVPCGGGFKFKVHGSHLYSCPSSEGNCYGNTLHVVPGEWYEIPGKHEFSKGFGEISNFRGWEVIGDIDGSETTELVYALKNGEACGEQVVLSTSNHRAGRQLLKLYPNPTRDHFRIEMPEGTERLQTMELHDIHGRVVRTWPAAQSPYTTGGLPAGMYVVRASGPEVVFTQKLVIE